MLIGKSETDKVRYTRKSTFFMLAINVLLNLGIPVAHDVLYYDICSNVQS